MNRNLLPLLLVLGLGVVIGYNNEAEIDDLCHRSKRMKRQMARRMQDVQDYFD